MRKVLLYTQEELDEKAAQAVACDRSHGGSHMKKWELEISNSEWPKLHVYYFHMDDGQGEHLMIIPLEGPK